MLPLFKSPNSNFVRSFSYVIFKALQLFCCIAYSNTYLSAEIIYLGEDLKKTFPFASDPAKRGADAPYISGNTYRSIANWCLDETNTPIDTHRVKKGDIIFVKGCLLDCFFAYVHPHLKEPYILLSCDADETNGVERQMPFINSNTLVVLGCVNCQEPRHPKIIPLPLGVPNGSAVGFPKKEEYTDLINKRINKSIFCSSNFSVSSHSWREHVYQVVQKKPFITVLSNSSPSTYLYNMAASQFCISPRGAGIDCFRTWEALILGCVPVLEKSPLDSLFYRLPVLLIDDYENITVEQLMAFQKYVIDCRHEFDLEKIYAQFWIDFFLKLQTIVRSDMESENFVRNFKQRTFNCYE